MPRPQAAGLLPLDTTEAFVVIDALVAYAEAEDRAGDPTHTVGIADEVAERVRQLRNLGTVDAQEWLRAIGVGRARGRAQG